MLEILYEDNHLLALNKPAMLATMGVSEDTPTLLGLAKKHIGRKYHKPGNVYLGVVSRLDAPVTGVVLLARTSKAARRLAEQFRERRVDKVYWAIVEGHVDPIAGELRHHLRKDERHRRMHVTVANVAGAQIAHLAYRIPPDQALKPPYQSNLTLLEVKLFTGRKHQIRVQLAAAGFPIVGDRKYGGRPMFPKGIALHARRLTVEHPVARQPLTITAPLPDSWHSFVKTPD
jgi:23S rRNA pseudouridine1911/1915/1917 synthase